MVIRGEESFRLGVDWTGWIFLSVSAAIFVLLLLTASQNLYWDGDYGIMLINMHDAQKFSQYLGISSRFGWAHPGPLNYYLMLPLYSVSTSGVQSMLASSFLLNAASLFGSAAIIRSMRGPAAASVFLVLAYSLILFVVGPRALWDVLVPYSTLCPWLLALVLTAFVAVRGLRWAPLLAFVLCFLTQAHVAFWLPCALLAFVCVGLSSMFNKPQRQDFIGLIAAVVVVLVLWLPPILEWKNLATIFAFFTRSGPLAHPFSEAAIALADLVGSSLCLAIPATLGGEWRGPVIVGIAALASVPLATLYFLFAQDKFLSALGIASTTSMLVFLVALTKFEGAIMSHSILYMSSLGLMAVLMILIALSQFVWRPELLLAGVTVGIVLVSAGRTSSALREATLPNIHVHTISESLITALEREPAKQTIFVVPDPAVWPPAIGAIAQAYRKDLAFRIEPFWSIIFGHRKESSSTGPGLLFKVGENAETITMLTVSAAYDGRK